jgi:hypothetical protein
MLHDLTIFPLMRQVQEVGNLTLCEISTEKTEPPQGVRKYKRYNTLQSMREEQELRHLDVYEMTTRN